MTDTRETTDAPDNAHEGTITFYELFDPPLESGSYSVTIQHHTASTDPLKPIDERFEASLDFAVLGARFSMPPTYVHTQFPPPNAQGEYSNVLAHIVFNVNTLPWQRDPRPKAAMEGASRYPWLALLTFDAGDPAPELRTGTLASFQPQNLPAGTVSYPDLKLDYGERWVDPCMFIDVEGEIFAQVAPTLEDMRWLAHARSIDQALALRKSETGPEAPAQEFSTIISNRLPVPGNKTSCYLVSLEHLAGHLPRRGPGGQNPPPNMRLAVLSSWSFGCVNQPETLREYFANLNKDNPHTWTPQVPYPDATGTPNQAVRDALEMGYTAFNHHTRQGADTVSWYRGPLLPYENPLYVHAPFTSPDALVRYNPDTGMFDVSLAAAWQIGQLLALNDGQFATLLYNWKRGQTLQAVAEFEKNFLAEQMGIDVALISNPDRPVHMQVMAAVIKPLLRTLLEKGQ